MAGHNAKILQFKFVSFRSIFIRILLMANDRNTTLINMSEKRNLLAQQGKCEQLNNVKAGKTGFQEEVVFGASCQDSLSFCSIRWCHSCSRLAFSLHGGVGGYVNASLRSPWGGHENVPEGTAATESFMNLPPQLLKLIACFCAEMILSMCCSQPVTVCVRNRKARPFLEDPEPPQDQFWLEDFPATLSGLPWTAR